MSHVSAKERRGTKAKPKRNTTPGGIVFQCVRGGPVKASEQEWTPARLVDALRVGLPISELHELQGCLDVPMERLAQILGISKATLHRRRDEGRLDAFESDRVVRFARLLGRAVEVLESEEAARQWLASPQIGLGGETPLVYAESEVGAREVEDLLGRIEHGVYS
jgi:putative toxin-antitoxin system antitoxin component (TIGR02293 family)